MDTKQHQTQAAPPSPRGRRSKTSLGWGPLVLAGVALVAVIAAAIWAVAPGGGASSRSESRPAPNTAATATEEPGEESERTISLWDPNTGDVRLVFSAPGKLDDAELSPDGERVVYERQVADGSWQIYLLEPDGTERPLTDLAGGAADPAWHPNGRAIAFAGSPREGSDADIFTIGVAGGSVRRIVGTSKDDGNPDWSPDGSRIVFDSQYGNLRGEIWVISVRKHALHQLAPRHSGNGAIEPAWSPDGRWIAYQTYHRYFTVNGRLLASTVRLMRPDGSHVHGIGRIDRYELWQQPSWSPDGRTLVIGRAFESLLLVDPATGRRHLVRGGSSGAPNWGTAGILMTPWLPEGVPAPTPAPPRFQVEAWIQAPGVDATVIVTRSSCELRGVNDPIRPGRLTLELVNHSPFETHVRLRRLRPGQSMGHVRADPPSVGYSGRWVSDETGPGVTEVWSSTTRFASGRWGVVCGKDSLPAPNGINWVPVGVAGPIQVG